MKNKIQFYFGLIASGFLASSALAQFSLTNDGTNNISNGTPEVAPAIYIADFVSTASFGVAMNDAGDITGTSYPDPGCGPFCLPPLETVVWRGGRRIVLPPVPGLTDITVTSINSDGSVAGFAGFPPTVATHAALWKSNGNTYTGSDLGVLPGTATSYAIGIDNMGRVVGWSTTLNFPPNGSPFMWSEAGGMVDLSAQGFPMTSAGDQPGRSRGYSKLLVSTGKSRQRHPHAGNLSDRDK